VNLKILRRKYAVLKPVLTERSRRLWAATEAREVGHGGIGLVEKATGISRSTIQRGLRELESGAALELEPDRTRWPGGGRKRTVEKDLRLMADLDALVEPTASGDPDSPLRWTAKSVRALAAELERMGHEVSYHLVADLLHELDYSLKQTARRVKARSIPIVTRSFATSMLRRAAAFATSSPRSRSTPRRRNW